MASRRDLLGWREWIALPDLGIDYIKAKVDTGARTSALHAYSVAPLRRRGKALVRFSVHPYQGRRDVVVACEAEIVDHRWVTDSGGHREKRYVIRSTAQLGTHSWPIEVTLTDRDTMKFRMLLGRTALVGHYAVDPGRSYLIGKPPLAAEQGTGKTSR